MHASRSRADFFAHNRGCGWMAKFHQEVHPDRYMARHYATPIDLEDPQYAQDIYTNTATLQGPTRTEYALIS